MSTPFANRRTFVQHILSSQLALLFLLMGVAAVFSLYVLLPMANGNSESRVVTSQASGQIRANAPPNQDVLSQEWLKQYHSVDRIATVAVVPNDVLSEEWLKQNRAGGASVSDSRRPVSQPMPDNYVGLVE